MLTDLKQLRLRLLAKISQASDQNSVDYHIRAAMKILYESNISGYLVLRFTEKCLLEIQTLVRAASVTQTANLHRAYKRLSDLKNELTYSVA